jgi:hypothetical protein
MPTDLPAMLTCMPGAHPLMCAPTAYSLQRRAESQLAMLETSDDMTHYVGCQQDGGSIPAGAMLKLLSHPWDTDRERALSTKSLGWGAPGPLGVVRAT